MGRKQRRRSDGKPRTKAEIQRSFEKLCREINRAAAAKREREGGERPSESQS